jgi:DNA polymerase III sliding clamp (beta) subunit (PCNA family)
MTSYIIKANELEAVALCASNEETRYYLNGIFFERYKDGSHSLTAMDGYRLASIRSQALEDVMDSFIIGSADIKKALTLYKAEVKNNKAMREHFKIQIFHQEGKLQVSVASHPTTDDAPIVETSFEALAIDGTFPNYRRVIPQPVEAEKQSGICAFNASYVADFGTIAKLLTCNKLEVVQLESTGVDCPLIVRVHYDGFQGVLMPIRL